MKKNIYIYNGHGTSSDSVFQTKRTLEKLLGEHTFYKIKTIGPTHVKKGNWKSRAVLFIMPGGADLPYGKHLSPEGNTIIRTYVEEGGAYLGICAGSYYGGSAVEFSLGTDLEVKGQRDLKFFSGTVSGPVLAPYDYKVESGARAANLKLNESLKIGSSACVFYNGGGCFVDADKSPGVEVLATYAELEHNPTAIVQMTVGKGIVILSGVHFEYDADLLDLEDEFLIRLIPTLKDANHQRLALSKALLRRLNLTVN